LKKVRFRISATKLLAKVLTKEANIQEVAKLQKTDNAMEEKPVKHL
jgi:hypothetical protein